MSHRLSNGLESEALRVIREKAECSADAAFSTLNVAVGAVLTQKAAFDILVGKTIKGAERHLPNLCFPKRAAALDILKGLPGVDDELSTRMRDELFPEYKLPPGSFIPD
tara:strand:+ start:2577 stop:2903 length:327 start_codon:yes stop_codon:yes gene_type:complete